MCNILQLRPEFIGKYPFTVALKLQRNNRIVELNWVETKVSYTTKKCKMQVQNENSFWLMLQLLA